MTKQKVCTKISLKLMHNYVKDIAAEKETLDIKIYGIRKQCAYFAGKYVEFLIASQLYLELDEAEDDLNYYNLDRPKEVIAHSFFQRVKQSLLEAVIFYFEDGSSEEVRIPLASQKVSFDSFNSLHLMLTDVPVGYPFADHFKI